MRPNVTIELIFAISILEVASFVSVYFVLTKPGTTDYIRNSYLHRTDRY